MYYMLNRLGGVKGFNNAPIGGTFPGVAAPKNQTFRLGADRGDDMYERLAIILFVLIVAAIGMGFVRRRGIQACAKRHTTFGSNSRHTHCRVLLVPRCHLCRNAQKPILERIVKEYGENTCGSFLITLTSLRILRSMGRDDDPNDIHY